MALTREIFLFFITNSFGQCYYVDQYGKVQTCQPGDANSWLDQAPQGWEDQQIGYGRNTKYWALNRTYSQPLKFVNDGATILRYLLYAKRGSEEQVYLHVNKFNSANDTYESYYKGEIDLMNNVDDSPLEGITVNIMEGGLLKLFKAYENTVFEIPCDGSVAENMEVNMDGMVFNAIFRYSTVPSEIIWKGTVIPMVYLDQQGSEVGAISGDQTLQTFDPQNTNAFNTILNGGSNYLFFNTRALKNVRLRGSFKITGSLANACLVAWTSLNNFYPLINNITSSRVPSGALTGAHPYNIDAVIPNLAAGEMVYLMLITLNGDGDGSVNFGTNNLSITFDSHFTESTVFALKPFDLLSLLLKKICATAFVYPENKVYTLQSNLLKQHSNLALTSGSALRKESVAVIKTSLAEFFDAFDSQLSACMGNTPSTQAPGEVLYFERLSYVLDSSNVTMDLGEVAKLKVKPATDLHFDLLKIGYKEQKYDEKQGNNEWNTTAQYKAPVKKVNKDLQKISPYRADAYGIEYTRTLVPTSNSANNKSDNDTFILNVDYAKTSNAQANINGVQGIYYGSGYFMSDAIQGLNRGRRMGIENVTGSGIASQFGITSTNGPSDTLRYLGGNTKASLSIQVQFSFRSDLSIYYDVFANQRFDNDPIYAKALSVGKYQITTGKYRAQFNTLYNGRIIDSQPLLLIGGQVNTFTLSKDLLNYSLGYSDQFQFEIIYDTLDATLPPTANDLGLGSRIRGYLLVFNIESFTIVASDADSTPVYGLTKKSYSVSTLPNASSAYNIEELSPVRLMQKHAGYIKSLLFNQLDRDLVFQVSDKNNSLSTTLDGVTITEGVNIPISTLPGEAMFKPFYFEFSTKVPMSFMQVLKNSANGHIKFSYCGNDFYGFPIDLKVKPALEDAQEWKLLCSPIVDLTTLVDIEYTGLDNIDIMKYNIASAHLSPVKFVQLGFMPSERYNFLHIDQDWFINQVGFWPFKENYFQKWQQNDTLELQCITNALGPVVADVIDSAGKTIDSFNYSIVTEDAVKSPLILWQASYSLSDLEEGIYYIKLTAGTGTTTSVMISEGLHVAAKWPVSLLFEYSSTKNRQATVFSSGYRPSFRVDAWIDDYMPNSKYTTYEDQPANLEMLNAIPYMNCTLNIGAEDGVPAWVIRLVDRILLLNRVQIDGIGYTREQDAKWDKIDVPNWPKKFYKIQLRESENNDFVAVYAEGELDDTLSLVYNIETDSFGDGTDSTGQVQVTKISK